MRVTNVVLVHGAWTDGSCWSTVIERLQQAGYNVTAVQLNLISLSEDVVRVRQVFGAQTSPTMLVAHAYGGTVITELGRDIPHVVGLVYLSAFAPDEGETMWDLIAGGPQPDGGAAIRPDEYGLIWLDRAGFMQYFSPDVEPTQARVLASVQKPIATSSWLGKEPFGEPAWKALPSWYLVTEQDQMILPAAQYFMARRAGAAISSLASGHMSMVSHPDVVATLIMQAAASTQEKHAGPKGEAGGEHGVPC